MTCTALKPKNYNYKFDQQLEICNNEHTGLIGYDEKLHHQLPFANSGNLCSNCASRYRQNGFMFQLSEDLNKLSIISDNTLSKLGPLTIAHPNGIRDIMATFQEQVQIEAENNIDFNDNNLDKLIDDFMAEKLTFSPQQLIQYLEQYKIHYREKANSIQKKHTEYLQSAIESFKKTLPSPDDIMKDITSHKDKNGKYEYSFRNNLKSQINGITNSDNIKFLRNYNQIVQILDFLKAKQAKANEEHKQKYAKSLQNATSLVNKIQTNPSMHRIVHAKLSSGIIYISISNSKDKIKYNAGKCEQFSFNLEGLEYLNKSQLQLLKQKLEIVDRTESSSTCDNLAVSSAIQDFIQGK